MRINHWKIGEFDDAFNDVIVELLLNPTDPLSRAVSRVCSRHYRAKNRKYNVQRLKRQYVNSSTTDIQDWAKAKLTLVELGVARLLWQGYTKADIAERMNTPTGDIRAICRRIKGKIKQEDGR